MKVLLIIICSLVCMTSCTRSGRRKPLSSSEDNSNSMIINNKKNVITMKKQDGVYYIPIDVNGVQMFFIFDTGASLISISATEASFLYKQGTLTDDDFLGTTNFMDANGNISEGTIINLKSVKVGNRKLTNIEASVVHNMKAPLLLGQSFLEQFGKISIDNSRGEITFE